LSGKFQISDGPLHINAWPRRTPHPKMPPPRLQKGCACASLSGVGVPSVWLPNPGSTGNVQLACTHHSDNTHHALVWQSPTSLEGLLLLCQPHRPKTLPLPPPHASAKGVQILCLTPPTCPFQTTPKAMRLHISSQKSLSFCPIVSPSSLTLKTKVSSQLSSPVSLNCCLG